MNPACHNILTQIGYPAKVICLDFETYFDKEYTFYNSSGKGLSVIEYVTDERFALTGLGVGFEDKPAYFVPPDQVPECIQWCREHENDYAFVVHHARFDITVLQVHFDWVPPFILDTLDLACHYDSRMKHSVEALAEYFDLPYRKGDTKQFLGYHWDDMDETMRANLAEYTKGDICIELSLFDILLPKLSDPVTEARLMRHNLDIWLHRPVAIDYELADDLRTAMEVKIEDATRMSGMTITELRSAKFVERLQEALPPGEKLPLKQGKRGKIPALAKADAGCQRLAAHPKEEVRNLVEARLLVKSWPTHIQRIDRICAQARANGGNLRLPTQYHGAHTGRNSGKEKINVLNLGGNGTGGIKTHPLISQMRNIIKALPDHVLGICDSSQIEARLAAWLAGCESLLTGFANGEDIYSDFMSPIVGAPIRKSREDDPPILAKYLDTVRGFGKTSRLGFQFGLGAETQYNKCLANPDLRPYFDNGTYDKGFVRGLVIEYRRKDKEIPELWNLLEGAFKRAICFQHLGPTTVNGKVTFEGKGTEVTITLPNGRKLYYTGCRIVNRKIKTDHGFLWGGSLLENLAQSICRDLLAYWTLKCEDEGIKVILTVYDEIVTMLEKDQADRKFARLQEIMLDVPDWAEGLPAGIEAQMSEFYLK